jgi:Protein of unknown function (DUF2786)
MVYFHTNGENFMTHDENKLKTLLDKIRKLKAKADDPSTTEAESLAFAAKVAELLAQHGLEEAQLKVEDQEEVGHEDYVANWNASPARRVLVIAICKLYFVKPLVRSQKGKPWVLIGRKHNIVMVKEMSEYLIKTTLRLSNAYGKTTPGANVIDFRRGCFKRLSERLVDLYDQQAKAAMPQWTPTGNPGNLPALYGHEGKLATAYMQRVFPNVGTLRPQRVKQGWDAMAGRAAGDKISLNRQVGGGGSSSYLLGKK